MQAQPKYPFLRLPSTRMGWWAIGLVITFILLFILNAAAFMHLLYEIPWMSTLLPSYGILMMAVGLVSGALGLVAIIFKKERSGLVWFTLLPGAFCLLFLLGEFLYPH